MSIDNKIISNNSSLSFPENTYEAELPDRKTDFSAQQFENLIFSADEPGNETYEVADCHNLFQSDCVSTSEVLNAAAPADRKTLENDLRNKILPAVENAVSKLMDSTTNDAVCDTAAGLTAAALKEMGYDVGFIEGNSHITLEVQTESGPIIIDPTMQQFFKDGTPTDTQLKETHGFIGTREELGQFLRDHHQDWVETGLIESYDQMLANYEKTQDPTDLVAEDKYPELFQTVIEESLYQPNGKVSNLTENATTLMDQYAQWRKGETVPEERAEAFEALNAEP